MARVGVYELAKDFGLESGEIMTAIEETGEFLPSASSTIEAPTAHRLKAKFVGQQEGRSGDHTPVSYAASKPVKPGAPAESSRLPERVHGMSSHTEVDPEDLTRVSRQVAALIAGPLEERLLNAYGQDWLSVVNQRRTSQGMNPMRSLSDSRACFRVFIHDPAADGWVSGRLRERARTILQLANKAAHNESLTERDLKVAQSILREFRRSLLIFSDKDRRARPVPGRRAPQPTVAGVRAVPPTPPQEEHAAATEVASDPPTRHSAGPTVINVDQLACQLGIDSQVVTSQLLRRGKNAHALRTYDDWLDELVPRR